MPPARPANSLRSILASVPRLMSATSTSGVHMYTSGNLLHVRVWFDRVVRESRLWLDIGEFACRRYLHRLEGAHSLVPPSHMVHVAHHRGGPCHFVTISGSGSFGFTGWIAHRNAQGRRHPLLGPQAAGGRRGRLTASLWAPVALSLQLHGGNVVRILLAPHEYTPGAARRSRVQ